MDKCAICGGQGSKICTGCREICYCSAEHQKQDWKVHKKTCCPFQLKYSPELARYIIASRDLKPRTVIIQESSMGIGPGDPEEVVLKNDEKSGKIIPFCLGCSTLMNIDPDTRCIICKWPICSKECEISPTHRQNECPLISQSNTEYDENMSFIGKTIMILRLLILKNSKPKYWTALFEMEDHPEIRSQRESSVHVDKVVYENLLKIWPNFEFTHEIIVKLSGIITVNSFSLERTCEKSIKDLYETKRLQTTKVKCIFKDTTLMQHSCVPNCRWTISSSPKFQMTIRTAVPVQKGQMLTIAYNGTQELFLGTLRRKQTILEDGLFDCQCPRCLDPSECGTHLSSLKCQKDDCAFGYLIPDNPIVKTSPWTCTSCGYVQNSSIILEFLDKIEKEIDRALEIEKMTKISPHKRLYSLEQTLKKISGVILHPNHYLLQKISRTIFTIYSNYFDIPDLEEELRDRFIWHCESLLKIGDVITPGFTFNRANLQYHLSGCWMRMGLKSLRKIHEDPDALIESLVFFRKIFNFQENSLAYFQDTMEPGGECSYCEELISLKAKSKECIDKLEALASVALFRA